MKCVCLDKYYDLSELLFFLRTFYSRYIEINKKYFDVLDILSQILIKTTLDKIESDTAAVDLAC